MDSSTFVGSTRRSGFVEFDDGLASLADMEAGFPGNHGVLTKSSCFNASNRSDSYRLLSSSTASTRSARFYDTRFEDQHHQPHFLESCFLCKKPLDNRDIFMYRGDTPFCSEACRQEQIEIDEKEKEKNWNLSDSMKALRKEQKKSTSTSNKTDNYRVRTGTVVAA